MFAWQHEDTAWGDGARRGEGPGSGQGARPSTAEAVVLLLFFLAPAAHPFLRPWVGVPSHLLWWIHVLPVALLTYRWGRIGAAPALLVSALLVLGGERLFGAGSAAAGTPYFVPADWSTAGSLTVALSFTNALVAGFAVFARRTAGELHHTATHDNVTGLPNRVLFRSQLSDRMARAGRRPEERFAVLYLDLDEFKRVNDSLGHPVGDTVLRRVAGRIQASIRREDVVARWGGDEFVILLDHVEEPGDALRIAERVLDRLQLPIEASEHEVVMTGSVGVTVSTPEYERPDEYLRDADNAMYRAKAAGTGECRLFDPSMHRTAVERLSLESELRDALRSEEFVLYFQPIVSLRSGQLRGVEALLRWRHPERGVVSPGEFISVAEETGLIVPLGRVVLRRACDTASRWGREFPELAPMRMSVNLSAQQLTQADFVETVCESCCACQDRGCLVELEITETVLMRNAPSTLDSLEALRHQGFTFAVDDFGTGYSSLAYLHRFPVDSLKIDRGFVSGETAGEAETEIVRAIVALAEQLGLETIAEGVETEQQHERMRSLGCTHAQGYHYAHPLPPEELRSFLGGTRTGAVAG